MIEYLSVEIPTGGWKDENHFNSVMFAHLSRIFPEGIIINSEMHPWLEAAAGIARNDLKPDFFYWPLGADSLIEMKENQSEFIAEGCVYGRPMIHCAFMVDIILDGKVTDPDSIPLEEIGKLFKYLDTMSRCRNSSPRGLFYNDKEYVVASYSGGVLQSIYRGLWTTVGCIEAIRNYLGVNKVNGTVKGLRHFVETYEGARVHLALGRGRYGCAFEVSLSTTAQHFVLKVVSAEANNPFTVEEYERLRSVGSKHGNLVARIVPNLFVDTESFVYYGLADLGCPAQKPAIPARAAFMYLFELHKVGIVHGDPRIPNIIILSDKKSLRWIDLWYPVCDTNMATDVLILAETIFGSTIAQNDIVQEYALHYQDNVSEDRMTAVYEYCKTLIPV